MLELVVGDYSTRLYYDGGGHCPVMVRTGTSGNIPYCNACSVTDSTIPHTSVTPVPTSVPGGSSVRR